MRQFKHIPTGKVIEVGNERVSMQHYIGNLKLFELLKGKDWEEINDKPQWTILSFKDSQGKICNNIGVGQNYYDSKFDTIQSVRREKDGEVFIVGDKLKSVTGIDIVIASFKLVDDTICCVNKNSVTIFMDSWRKVQPKEWEITAFKSIDAEYILRLFPDGKYKSHSTHGGYWEKELINTSKWKIYSVKRLSDNVEFNIGDITQHGKITDFTFIDSSIRQGDKFFRVICKKGSGTFTGDISSINKVDKLFTTENGVDIYEGDLYHVVQHIKNNVDYLGEIVADKSNNRDFPNIHTFSSRIAAEEYNVMNKPCLSIKDVSFLLESDYYGKEAIKKLKELVKTKLK